jgi:tRNA-dihydrouridine synthase A
LARHILGLYRGQPGGRAFRRALSGAALKHAGPEIFDRALAAVRGAELSGQLEAA